MRITSNNNNYENYNDKTPMMMPDNKQQHQAEGNSKMSSLFENKGISGKLRSYL